MNWIPFDKAGPLPLERRCVLVKIDSDVNEVGGVAVGYLRIHSDGPFFVCSAIPGRWTVTHWCDCLGDDFVVPGWHCRQPIAEYKIPITPEELSTAIEGLSRNYRRLKDFHTDYERKYLRGDPGHVKEENDGLIGELDKIEKLHQKLCDISRSKREEANRESKT